MEVGLDKEEGSTSFLAPLESPAKEWFTNQGSSDYRE